jgi:hypothetical protein
MTDTLAKSNRFTDPDAAYRLIIEAHRGLSDQDSAALDARLVLILANEVGDIETLRAALRLANAGDSSTGTTEAG